MEDLLETLKQCAEHEDMHLTKEECRRLAAFVESVLKYAPTKLGDKNALV